MLEKRVVDDFNFLRGEGESEKLNSDLQKAKKNQLFIVLKLKMSFCFSM